MLSLEYVNLCRNMSIFLRALLLEAVLGKMAFSTLCGNMAKMLSSFLSGLGTGYFVQIGNCQFDTAIIARDKL